MKKQIIRFLIVGILNTGIGIFLIFMLYNLAGLGYWVSSAAGYIIGGIFSYFANKKFTFENTEKNNKTSTLFVINLVICYILAYSIAKPIVYYILRTFSVSLVTKSAEQISLLFGMMIYTILNFLGQKFVCFKTHHNNS